MVSTNGVKFESQRAKTTLSRISEPYSTHPYFIVDNRTGEIIIDKIATREIGQITQNALEKMGFNTVPAVVGGVIL